MVYSPDHFQRHGCHLEFVVTHIARILILLLAVGAPLSAQENPPADSPKKLLATKDNQSKRVAEAIARGELSARLEPRTRDAQATGPRWSPKGTQVSLERLDEALVGELQVGQVAKYQVAWQFDAAKGTAVFSLDLDGDGHFSEQESQSLKGREQRGKMWFSTTAILPLPSESGTREYPINLWYVEDPLAEEDAALVMRWTRTGWYEGRFTVDGREAFVVLSEALPDGQYDRQDAWGLGWTAAEAYQNSLSRLREHAWLDGVAYQATDLHTEGRRIAFRAFDPGFTQEEERERKDPYAADKKLKRAEQPVVFGDSLEAAQQAARQEGKLIFVDFETTWCGPCKMMDRYVYNAQITVDAMKPFLAVKLDGDEEREWVKSLAVEGYPTMLILGPDGEVLARTSGYTSAAKLVEFLAKVKGN